MAGYPGDQHNGIFMYRKHAASSTTDCMLNCGTLWLRTQGMGGHSGGPHWVIDNGVRHQTAIHSTGDGDSSYGALLWDSATVRDPWNWLSNWLAHDRANLRPQSKPEIIEYVHGTGHKGLLADTAASGGFITVDWNAYNVGFAHTGRMTVRFYLSRDRSIRSTDTLIGTISLSGLGENTRFPGRDTFTIPADQPAGSYYVGYTMGGTVSEYTIEDNVVLIDERLTVTVPVRSDLIVEPPTVGNNMLTPGQSFTLSATVRNQGAGTAPDTRVGFFRSSSFTISTGDLRVGSIAVPGLRPNYSIGRSITDNAPRNPGVYYYGACVSIPPGGESDTANNCSVGVPVTVSSRDRAALVAFYNATGGPNWRIRTNWNTTAPLDQWSGVTTDAQGRVTRLALGGIGLTGGIPDVVGDLSALDVLILRENRLTGRIPDTLGNLVNMTQLHLRTNDLTGTIPAALANLTNLSRLTIDSDTGLCLEPGFPSRSGFATLARNRGLSVCSTGFTDDPIVAGETPVRAVHFTELRGRIDNLRGAHGLGRFSWTDSTLAAGVAVRGVHMSELRTALRQTYDAAGRTIGFNPGAVQTGSEMRARHIDELRRAVEALER